MTADADKETNESFEMLSAEAMVRVNDQCDEYERRRSDGDAISVGGFLKELNLPEGGELQILVRELVVIDLHHRFDSGKTPRATDYAELTTLSTSMLERLIDDASAASPDQAVMFPNQRIGDYVVLEEIGRGGMGQVCRAEHLLMNRQVAIKMLTNRVSHDPLARRRFEREVRTVGKLSHRNVVAAFDARLDGDALYLVTEWIFGSDLSRLVEKEGPLPSSLVINYSKQAARGLRYAHDQGLIHRDVKPSNLLVDQNGVVKVLDLGLAKLLYEVEDDEAPPDAITKSTHIIGTPAYLAPEQARSALDVDLRSDIYSLGCTMYYMLTAELPYKGATQMATILAHTEQPTPSVAAVRPDVPEQLSELVQAMMEKDPKQRPQSMDDVLDELVSIQSIDGTLADTTEMESSRRFRRSRKKAPSLLKSLLKSVLIALPTLVVLASFGHFYFGKSDIKTPATYEPTGGMRFDGQTSYSSAPLFLETVDESVMIEVLITPEQGPTPSNVASWTGRNSFFLFSSTNETWGVGTWVDGVSRLRMAHDPMVLGQTYLLAGRWDGDELAVFINGHEIETEPTEYRLFSATPMLCFGGAPPDLLPIDTGPRFFTGLIHAARVSKGLLPEPAQTADELLVQRPSTVALFRFKPEEREHTIGLTHRKHKLLFNNTQWQSFEQ